MYQVESAFLVLKLQVKAQEHFATTKRKAIKCMARKAIKTSGIFSFGLLFYIYMLKALLLRFNLVIKNFWIVSPDLSNYVSK